MSKKFEFLEHTADTKIRAFGSSLEEAFSNVVLATTETMTDLNSLKNVESKEIRICSEDEKSLLYDFLDEVLYLFDIDGFLVMRVDDLKIIRGDVLELACTLRGDFVSSGYDIRTTIKAVTYSEMEIFKEDGLFVVQIVHDL